MGAAGTYIADSHTTSGLVESDASISTSICFDLTYKTCGPANQAHPRGWVAGWLQAA